MTVQGAVGIKGCKDFPRRAHHNAVAGKKFVTLDGHACRNRCSSVTVFVNRLNQAEDRDWGLRLMFAAELARVANLGQLIRNPHYGTDGPEIGCTKCALGFKSTPISVAEITAEIFPVRRIRSVD
jgi:hypothetical protein